MTNKTRTVRRALAMIAVPPLLAASLVGCGDKSDGNETSPEGASSEQSQGQQSQSPESQSSEASTPQDSQGSGSASGASPASPKFMEFMKDNVSSDYRVVDLSSRVSKPDVGAGAAADQCPATVYGAADLVKYGAQVVTAVQSGPKQKAVTVLMFGSADKANAALDQVNSELDKPECKETPINGKSIKIEPLKDTHGFDKAAGMTLGVQGEDIDNLFATKGQFMVIMIGDLDEVVADGKKVYDALP
ncbi:hypothetical protein [Pseudoglutamicibacter albus]|uniref:Secreted protein n=1 Tax=Pseudoglutamicibacter albus TaxID=98671 RepID=A0ABU1Z1M6_9MICC|nr:hypothetical protein [Pseudoglutamicibacter albus]MDR7294514.1 hypothetical protein [Pseudoglutamicibacter albus]